VYISDFVGPNLTSIFKCLKRIARKKVRNITFSGFEKQIAQLPLFAREKQCSPHMYNLFKNPFQE